jgi:NitT/TauT family transport system permease protein
LRASSVRPSRKWTRGTPPSQARAAWRGVGELYRSEGLTHAASIAFYALLSILPFFLLLFSVIGALTADYLVGSSSGGRSGLGITALLFSARNEIPALYATALVGCVLGFALVAVVSGLSWLVLHRWHDSYSPSDK